MRAIHVCVLLVVLALMSGCASIVGETTSLVRLNVNPNTALVSVKDQFGTEVYRQAGPGTVPLKKGRGYFKRYHYTVTASAPGYQTRISGLDDGVSLWYALGNLGFGGLIGWLIVDPLTGAMWTIEEVPPMIILDTSQLSPQSVQAR